MPVLHLQDVPKEVYERLQQRAAAHHSTLEAEAVALLNDLLLDRPPSRRSQAELLAELRRRSFTPPPGTPDSVTLLAEDRGR
jgi:plasmid stability protein